MHGVRHAGELAEALGGSRVALKRAYERHAHQFLRLGRARATRYAARQNLTGLDTDEFRVFRVDGTGGIEPAGTLVTLAATESVWLPDENIIDGLPPEMQDITPRGFLDRFQNLQHETHTANDFPALSNAAIAGEYVGSSVGGEQPKFTAFVDGQHRIIKFATDTTDNARRWQDLLTLEHVALQTLRDAYGALIANTDRHQYNVSLFPVEGAYLVAPAFDQLPMAYAPSASGNLRNSAIAASRPAVNTLAIWGEARELAAEFWRRASERHLSASMQAIVREHSSR